MAVSTVENGKPRRLGRGLSALLADAPAVPVEVAASQTNNKHLTSPTHVGSNAAKAVDGLVHISLERIERSRFQPRRVFDEASIRGLAESIRASGLMQPVIVRPRSESGGGFELIAGERR